MAFLFVCLVGVCKGWDLLYYHRGGRSGSGGWRRRGRPHPPQSSVSWHQACFIHLFTFWIYEYQIRFRGRWSALSIFPQLFIAHTSLFVPFHLFFKVVFDAHKALAYSSQSNLIYPKIHLKHFSEQSETFILKKSETLLWKIWTIPPKIIWNISQSCFVGALWAPSAVGGDARNLWIMPPRKTITMITGMLSSVIKIKIKFFMKIASWCKNWSWQQTCSPPSPLSEYLLWCLPFPRKTPSKLQFIQIIFFHFHFPCNLSLFGSVSSIWYLLLLEMPHHTGYNVLCRYSGVFLLVILRSAIFSYIP